MITEVFGQTSGHKNTNNQPRRMKRDGWLKEPSGVWILRFRYEWSSWDQNLKVFVDKGRLENNGMPLLKSRKRMRRNLAIQLWKNLLAAGWRGIKPQWE